MMQIAAYGRLGNDPRPIPTAKGTPMAVASIAVTLHDKEKAESTYWLGVVAFGRAAEALLNHAKGDLVSLAGRAQMNAYTTADGNKREQLQIVADAVIFAHSAGVAATKARTSNRTAEQSSPSAQSERPVAEQSAVDEFGDDVPF